MATTLNLDNGFTVPFELPNLRNGELGTINAVVPSSAIPPQYYWLGIADMPIARAVAFLEILARGYYAQIRALAPTIAADVARGQAIVLAGIRTGTRVMWQLVTADLSASEMSPAMLTYRAPVGAVAAAANVPAVAGIAEGVSVNFAGGTADASRTAWNGWQAMSAEENLVATHMITLAIAVLPTQGWSLVKTGHHYLSDGTPAMKAGWNALKKQYDSKIPAEVKTWIDGRTAWWSDIAFHKACHPVSMAVKLLIAGAVTTPAKLTKAGFGSAAVRLPATDPAFEYAKLVQAILTKTAGLLVSLGAEVYTEGLTQAVTRVFETDDAAARAERIAYAVSLAHSQDPLVAVAAGMLAYLTEEQAGNTITRSYGYKRLVSEYPAEMNMGRTLATAQTRRQRELIAEGKPIALKINFPLMPARDRS